MWRLRSVVVVTLLLTSCATHTATSGRVAIRDDRAVIEVGISASDRAVIENYYRSARPKPVPPGLVKRETPPPGLARRDVLPPGLLGRPLPYALETRLTVLPPTTVRVIIGHDIVLLQRDTRVVLDIQYGVVPD
jgi:hypothetical protein